MNQPLSLCELHFTHLDNGVSTKSVLCACVCVCVCVCVVPLIKHLCSLKMCSSTDRDFLFLLSIFLLSNYSSTLPTNVYCAHGVCQTVGCQGNTTLRTFHHGA